VAFEPPKLRAITICSFGHREPLPRLSTTTQHPKRWGSRLYLYAAPNCKHCRGFFLFYHHLREVEARDELPPSLFRQLGSHISIWRQRYISAYCSTHQTR